MSTDHDLSRSPVRRRSWWNVGLDDMWLFPRCIIIGSALFVVAGAIFGLVRDHSFPLLFAAMVEGAILVGVPGAVVSVIVAGVAVLIDERRRATRARRAAAVDRRVGR